MDQLIIGIQEKEWKEKLIAMGNNLELNKAIKVVESLETGKLSMNQIDESGEMNKISEYRGNKTKEIPNYFNV